MTRHLDPPRRPHPPSNRDSRRGPNRPNRARPAAEVLEGRIALTGTLTPLVNAAPDTGGINAIMLLSDGTVMGQGGGDNTSTAWYRLSPDARGSYANGTWSSLAPSNTARLDYPSNVLPDGRVFTLGGEYYTDYVNGRNFGVSTTGNDTNKGEIYDPVADTWSRIQDFPQANFGDGPTQVLADGSILAGYQSGPQTYIYHPSTNTWTQAATKLDNDSSGEETWLKLSDGSILSYDISSPSKAQRYLPSQNRWVETGSVPVALSGPAYGSELGPGLLLPDGRAFYLGATGKTAFYTPSTNSWSAGPTLPDGYGCDDAPGAMMVDGKVLFAADVPKPATSTSNFQFGTSATLFEFDPSTNAITKVPLAINPLGGVAFVAHMLALPNGQVLVGNDSSNMYVYTPGGPPLATGRPTIAGITDNSGAFVLSGDRINGNSQGASYGDDAEADSNYPIIRISNASGEVYYARTFNWSSTGVGEQGIQSTRFTLPASLPAGSYQLVVVANGIASDPVPFVAPTQLSLARSFNRIGIVADGSTFSPGFDGAGHAFSGKQLGSSVPSDGLPFRIGPAGRPDVVSALGQNIQLPRIAHSQLSFLAAGVNGNQAGQPFRVNYADGTVATTTLSISDWATPQSYPGESLAYTTSYRDTSGGGTQAGSFNLYSYRLALDPSKVALSLTLPSNPNVNILAIDLFPATAQVDLSGSFSNVAIATPYGPPTLGGLFNPPVAYSASSLGSAVVAGGQPFRLGAANRPDAVLAQGQTINLPAGKFSQLDFLGGATYFAQAGQLFTIHYTDGTSTPFYQAFSGLTYPQGFAGETVAVTMTSAVSSSGSPQFGRYYLYNYAVSLDPGRTVASITLPYDQAVRILAIDLVAAGLGSIPAARSSVPSGLAVTAGDPLQVPAIAGQSNLATPGAGGLAAPGPSPLDPSSWITGKSGGTRRVATKIGADVDGTSPRVNDGRRASVALGAIDDLAWRGWDARELALLTG